MRILIRYTRTRPDSFIMRIVILLLNGLQRISFNGISNGHRYMRKSFWEEKTAAISFNYFFAKGRFTKAYRKRIELAVKNESLYFDTSEYGNYLDIVLGEFAMMDNNLSNAVKRRLDNRKLTKLLEIDRGDTEFMPKILMLGPSFEPIGEELKSFDLVVITKPIDLALFHLDPLKTLVVLNNVWSIRKSDEVLSWIDKYPSVNILTPNTLNCDYQRSELFSSLLRFPFGSSLMGFQRALVLILTKYHFTELRIEGFDFMTSPKSYANWYPSLFREEGFISRKRANLLSNMTHDLLLNFAFTKQLLKGHDGVTGSITDLINLDGYKLLELFYENNS